MPDFKWLMVRNPRNHAGGGGKGGTKILVVQAPTNTTAKRLWADHFDEDFDAEASGAAWDHFGLLIEPSNWNGWTFEFRISAPPGALDEDAIVVRYKGTVGDTTRDLLGANLAAALNAHPQIANAAFSSPTLTVAGAADGLGDRSFRMTHRAPGAVRGRETTLFVSGKTQAGDPGDALSFTLQDGTSTGALKAGVLASVEI